MSAEEEWRPVVGWEGLYEVSSLGRVRSLDRVVEDRGKSGVERQRHMRGRVRALISGSGSYLTVGLADRDRKCTRRVHVLVCEAFHGSRPEGFDVAHGDGNATNNAASNLRWATRSENMADCADQGTKRAGEKHPSAKLTSSTIYEIRSALGTCREIADRFGCSPMHVSRIKRGLRRAVQGFE